ncbi:MAG TPA: serine protease [Candidatus Paceibacterota bacterium]|nr:serine protease [Candidatus Paceibacterota bacterium]
MEIISTLLSAFVAMGAALTMFVGNVVDTYIPSDTVVSVAPVTGAVSPPPPRFQVVPNDIPIEQEEYIPVSAPVSANAPKPLAASTTPAQPPAAELSADVLNDKTRAALVNILCLTKTNKVHPISGSGVFVDSRGIVLTNAHVGQMFLLSDYPTRGDVDCTLRTGSPAAAAYKARLLYLPPAWIEDHAPQITLTDARGTGENDYAFLIVTDTVSAKDSLPASFPALSMTIDAPKVGQNMFLAAYPAGFLDGTSIRQNLYPSSAFAAVKELFTFTKRTVDLVSIGGTVVSQGGSSGGAAVRTQDGRLQGIITTSTTAGTTEGRDLRAVTLAHINRSLLSYDKGGIEGLLSKDVVQEAKDFESSAAAQERAALIKALKAQ